MQYLVNWYIENEIIYVSSLGEGDVSANEVRDLILSVKRLMNSSPNPLIHIIIDVGNIIQPISLKEIIEILHELGPHERAGWHIIVREKSKLVKMGVAIGISLFKFRTRSLDTIAEAEVFLKEMDTTLSWERADRSIFQSGVE